MTIKATVGATCEPGTSRRNKTGAWRTFRPVYDHEKCVRCGMCEIYCPEGIIHYNEERDIFEPDYEYCKGCGLCARECPKKAIEMVLEVR